MDISALTQLVGSLGFPIVCCAYMMVSMNKTIAANTEATNSLAKLVTKLMNKCGVEAGDVSND